MKDTYFKDISILDDVVFFLDFDKSFFIFGSHQHLPVVIGTVVLGVDPKCLAMDDALVPLRIVKQFNDRIG